MDPNPPFHQFHLWAQGCREFLGVRRLQHPLAHPSRPQHQAVLLLQADLGGPLIHWAQGDPEGLELHVDPWILRLQPRPSPPEDPAAPADLEDQLHLQSLELRHPPSARRGQGVPGDPERHQHPGGLNGLLDLLFLLVQVGLHLLYPLCFLCDQASLLPPCLLLPQKAPQLQRGPEAPGVLEYHLCQ